MRSNVTPLNPNGCFDWWGYNTNPTTASMKFATKEGMQMLVVGGEVSILAGSPLTKEIEEFLSHIDMSYT